MPDICIDVPAAYTALEKLGNKLHDEGIMSEYLYKEMPVRYVFTKSSLGFTEKSWRLFEDITLFMQILIINQDLNNSSLH